MRRQGAINLAGALIKVAAAVVGTPLTINYCGLGEFGRWSFLLSVATILATTDLGLPTTVNVYLAPGLGGGRAAATSARVSYVAVSSVLVAIAMGVVASGFVLVGPSVAATRKFFTPGPSDFVLAASMGLFVASRILATVAAAFLQAEQNYRAFVLIGLTFVLPTAVGLPLAALFGFDARAFLHLHTAFSVISLLAYLIPVARMRRQHAWRFAVDRQEWSGMARFGIGSWLGSAGGIVFSQFDRVVIGILLSVPQLGIYAACTQVTSQINALSAIPVQPLLPYVARYAHDIQSHLSDLRTLVSDAIRVNTAVALGLSGLIAVCAPVVAAVLVEPPDTAAVTSTLRILAAVYGVYSLNAVGFYCLFATHDVKRLCFITIGSGLLSLGTIAIGAQVAGLTGAAIGNATYVATLALAVVALRRFDMSVVLWLRMIRVPLCAWASVVGFAVLFDIQGIAAIMVSATLFLVVLLTWAFTPLSARDASLALMKGASTPK